MTQSAVSASEEPAETALRQQLAQGDAVLQSVTPVMRHLFTGAPPAIFADEVLARVRGGTIDVARQLLDAISEIGTGERGLHDDAELETLAAALADLPGFLAHVHAQAIEWQLTERLQTRLALDPVLPPLLQALLASEQPATSTLAMNLLAAQARFAQTQRRMAFPLMELPADLLNGVLVLMRSLGRPAKAAAAAEAKIRAEYDESRTREGLAARVVTEMGGGAVAGLSLAHGGVAIFATALSMAAGQGRDVVALSTSDGHGLRLALTLRAAGLPSSAIEEQLLTVQPDAPLPNGWDQIGAERAAELLAATSLVAGS